MLSGVTMTSTKTKNLVDARVDLYALGVMLYEMVAGVSPYPEGLQYTDHCVRMYKGPFAFEWCGTAD